jgi:uncharacterized protein (TIGR02996 family)
MDLLSQHEAFLRAIFDAPDDDTPRLVYADFLQEHGEQDRAEFIRWQCGRGDKPDRWPVGFGSRGTYERGFRLPGLDPSLALGSLSDPVPFRRELVEETPELFGLKRLRLGGGRIVSAEPFDTLFGLVAFARVTELELTGEEVADAATLGSDFTTFTINPVITTTGVIALAQHRGARRLTALDLRNNDLDNDAARELVRSPYLDNLKRLRLLEGNRLRGKVWQQVIARFGDDVVG